MMYAKSTAQILREGKLPPWPFEKGNFPKPDEVRAYIETCRQWLLQKQSEESETGFFLLHHQTYFVDQLLQFLFDSAKEEYFSTRSGPTEGQVCALLGAGGYGRQELCPHSDIDLLFLYPQKMDAFMENLAERMLYVLWDSGLEVGHSIRTLDQCVHIGSEDSREATSMLDARLIHGERSLFEKLVVALEKNIFSKKSLDHFLKVKLIELRQRHQKYGSSVYLLEPNVKEGRSCVRDFNTIEWILKARYRMDPEKALRTLGLLTKEDLEEFYKAKDLLFRLRFYLHFRAGRRQDILDFDSQEAAAKAIGFSDMPKGLAVERFMQKFYLNAAMVERHVEHILFQVLKEDEGTSHRLLRRMKRQQLEYGLTLYQDIVNLGKEDLFRKEPLALVGVFRAIQKHRATLTPTCHQMIRKNLSLVDDSYRQNPKAREIFLEIFKEPKGLSQTLETCHRTGFLSAFIPEFSHLNCLVLHDLYHIYTVDTHLLFAVKELEKLARDKEVPRGLEMAREVLHQVNHFHVLALAVLFHDIGKGIGKGHSVRGAEMMLKIGKRLGLSDKETKLLEALVRHHLLMAHTTQRRDIHDPKQVIEFCKTIANPETLRCLYILTICDIRAVGPDVWNDWKGSLLNELYRRALQVMEKGAEELERKSQDVSLVWEGALELLGEKEKAAAEELYDLIPPRFLMVHQAKEISEFLEFIFSSSLNPKAGKHVQVKGKKCVDKGYFEFAIFTFDHPGLFAQLAGVMAAHHFNILGVETSTWSDGRVLDVFRVVNSRGNVDLEEGAVEDLTRDLNEIISGEKDVDSWVKKLRATPYLNKNPLRSLPTQVLIQNELSEFYTVIEIFAPDRIGFLYDVAKVFRDQNLSIQTALISTDVDHVADVFYVRDSKGNKIGSDEKLSHLKEELLNGVQQTSS